MLHSPQQIVHRNQFNNNLFKHFAQSEKEEVMRFANKCLQLMPH